MKHRKMMLDGNGAAAEAMKLAKVSVIAAYPITPQSPIAEKLAEMVQKGEIKGKYVCVESEHSALSYIIGAQLTGVRAGTATSSVGLALMHEVLGVASGCRIPVLMPVVNRALASPWSLWCDHQDAMAERDSGWLQFYAEDVQEVLDLVLMGYRIAEHEKILLPVMVCMDGFFVSHSLQPVWVPEQGAVDSFLPEYTAKNLHLDVKNPMFINNLTPPEEFTEMRYQQEIAFQNALVEIPKIQREFKDFSRRDYFLVNAYRCEDAQAAVVCMGSMCGTVRHVVEKLRDRGLKVGAVKITSFRPFPGDELQKVLSPVPRIGIIDRSAGLGAEEGPLCLETRAAMKGKNCGIANFIAGLGGRDVTEKTIEKIFYGLMDDKYECKKNWVDTKPDALEIRKQQCKI